MATNFAGSLFRLYPWQTKHYLVRGGPYDPVIQTSGNAGSLTGGYLNVANSVTLNPIPGTQTPPAVPLPRVQSQNSGGSFSTSTAALTSNTGGVYIGTIPGGSWIESVEAFCYTTLSGGTSVSWGIFWAPSETFSASNTPGFQPATLFALAYLVTAPAANTMYTTRTMVVTATNNALSLAGVSAVAEWTGWALGPGTGPTGTSTPTGATLAGLGPPGGEGFGGIKDLLAGGASPIPGDIDLYAVSFLTGGSGTANTAGNFQVKVEFTGLVG